MCHDYLPEGRKDYVWETTVEAEREANVHIHDGVSEDSPSTWTILHMIASIWRWQWPKGGNS